jgi:UDP-N-acetylenolpyruvoylglucosamine reductase
MTETVPTPSPATGLPASAVEALARGLSADAVQLRDEALARRTTLRVGGPVDLYVEPACEADLGVVLHVCGEFHLPFFVLGRGSNLVVRDGGFRGVAISLSKPCFSQVLISGDRLQCGAGARLKTIAVEARRNGLAGLEFLEGIPGTLGGALRMNAGAMGGATFEVVETVRLMDYSGRILESTPAAMAVAYRSCATLKNHVALGAVLRGKPDAPHAIEQRMTGYSQKRWASQPAAPSAGCMFKNPAAIPAGRLIDELGLKGTRVGGAVVSLEHGNFLVNAGNATARDVLALIEVVRARAKSERGIDLEAEVEIIGEDLPY